MNEVYDAGSRHGPKKTTVATFRLNQDALVEILA